jgi:callose synthase
MCVVLINLVQILCGELLYTDEWTNFLTRINRDENAAESELFSSANDILELRLWASYRGQTLARTGLL